MFKWIVFIIIIIICLPIGLIIWPLRFASWSMNKITSILYKIQDSPENIANKIGKATYNFAEKILNSFGAMK